MSHDTVDDTTTFFCDAPGCEGQAFGSSFNDAKDHVESLGWVALKRVNRPWEDFCASCATEATRQHVEHKKREAHIDRMKVKENERLAAASASAEE